MFEVELECFECDNVGMYEADLNDYAVNVNTNDLDIYFDCKFCSHEMTITLYRGEDF